MDSTQASAPYDDWAAIYDVWADTAGVTHANLPYYVRMLTATAGPAVELGVGNGRIAIEAAKQGKTLIGVDSSSVMLSQCRQRARAAGVAERLSLVKADFRDFALREPAELVVIPFHAMGHMLTLDDKRACLRHVHEQLAPGGRLIFDHFVFDAKRAMQRQGAPFLRGTYVDADTGRTALLWMTSLQDLAAQQMQVFASSEEMDAGGIVVQTKIRRLRFSWITPDQARLLLEEVGFEIESCWGAFDETPLTEASQEQIWVARRKG